MAIGGGHRAPSRVANVKNTVQPVQPSLDLEANRHEAIFLFHSSTTVSSTCSYRIRSSYTSKCPVRPVFPCPNHVSLHHPRCASSREQFRTVSPLSRDPSFDRVEQGQRVPAIRFSFPQNGKESEEEEKKKNKSRATLVLSMVIPKKDDAGQRCGHCPFSRSPLLSHLFDRLDLLPPLRKELAESPLDHPPSRFIVEKPDFDGWTEARAKGSGLEKFFKVGQWRCSGYVRIGDGIGEGWKTFSVSYRGGIGSRFEKIEVRRYILVVRKTLLGFFIFADWNGCLFD